MTSTTSDLTIQEKLTFLQREVKDKRFEIAYAYKEGDIDSIVYWSLDNEEIITVTEDYFKSRVSDWKIANQYSDCGLKSRFWKGKSSFSKMTVKEYFFIQEEESITSIVKLSNKMAGDKK